MDYTHYLCGFLPFNSIPPKFDDAQRFFFSRSGYDYELPSLGGLDSYIKQIERLPLVNGPAVFGLHPNAEINYFATATKPPRCPHPAHHSSWERSA